MKPTKWMTGDQLARRQEITKRTIERLARDGASSGGWTYESRPITDADRKGLGVHNGYIKVVYRAVPVDPNAATYVICDIVCGRLLVEWSNEDLERVRKRVRSTNGYVRGEHPPTVIFRVRGQPPREGHRLEPRDWTEETLEVVESGRPIELPWMTYTPDKEQDVSTAQVEAKPPETTIYDWQTAVALARMLDVSRATVDSAATREGTASGHPIESRPATDEDREALGIDGRTTTLYRAVDVEEAEPESERIDQLARKLKEAKAEKAALQEKVSDLEKRVTPTGQPAALSALGDAKQALAKCESENERHQSALHKLAQYDGGEPPTGDPSEWERVDAFIRGLVVEIERLRGITVRPDWIQDIRPIAVALGVPPTVKLIVQRIGELEAGIDATAEESTLLACERDEAREKRNALIELLARVQETTDADNFGQAVARVQDAYREGFTPVSVLHEKDRRIAELEEQLAQANMDSMSTLPWEVKLKSPIIDAAWNLILLRVGVWDVDDLDGAIQALAEALRESHRGAA